MRGHGESDYPTDPAAYSEALTVGDMAGVLLDLRRQDGDRSPGCRWAATCRSPSSPAIPSECGALMLFDTGPGFKKDEARDQVERDARSKRAADLDARGLAALEHQRRGAA